MKNINLIQGKVNLLRKTAQKTFALQTASLVIVVCYCLIVFGAFSYQLILKQQSKILQEKIKVEETGIEALKPLEAKQLYLTTKTKSLVKIISSKKENQQIVEAVLAYLPEGISVSNFQIDEKGQVGFSASSNTFKALTKFLEIINTNESGARLKIKQAVIDGVNYGLEKKYNISINLTFYLPERK